MEKLMSALDIASVILSIVTIFFIVATWKKEPDHTAQFTNRRCPH